MPRRIREVENEARQVFCDRLERVLQKAIVDVAVVTGIDVDATTSAKPLADGTILINAVVRVNP